MMTTSTSVCPNCGTMEKSGKSSCCGRGGSWFLNCGSSGNTKLYHTWSEGMLACKTWAQWNTVRSRQPNAVRQLKSSYGIVVGNFKAFTTADKTFTFTLTNASTLIQTANASNTAEKLSTKHETGTINSQAINTPDNDSVTVPSHTSMTNNSTTLLTNASIYTITLTTRNSATITVTTTTTTMIIHTAKTATVTTDWIFHGICCACDASIMLIWVHLYNIECFDRTYTHIHTLPIRMQT